jgi:hypothetical protein
MMFGGELWECRITKKDTWSLKKHKHLLLWHSVLSQAIKKNLFVDFLIEDFLNEYLKKIDEEVNKFKMTILKNIFEIKASAYMEYCMINSQPLPIVIPRPKIDDL